ncbi:MAG: hypothetical protein EHM53_08490 [Methanoregulaceae archaeon]|nr:MAG: hypothetical protein EHM53_08490 [Methanoregulaceae archaeon]
MSRAHDLFRPNGLKLLLAATLLVPVFFVIVLVNGFLYNDLIFPSVITTVISYGAACVIDDAIRSRPVKIAIASGAALVSIILGSILVRGMTMVCDPVHDPGMVCDPVHTPEPAAGAPTVLVTVQPDETALIIVDSVHEPDSCSGDICELVPAITTGIVAQKLDACLKKVRAAGNERADSGPDADIREQ